VPCLGHAGDDDALFSDGNPRHAGDHLHPDRRRQRLASADFHRRPHFSPTAEPSFVGYSVGQWIDEDGDGKFDVLAVETRNFKGPRAYDNSGLTLHEDNKSIIKERIYLDKADKSVLHDEITVIDTALARPWTVVKNYKREADPKPVWHEDVCAEGNEHVRIGRQNYMLSADGFLMPAKKDQAPPDLKYFKPSAK
jgi:hypothetical protein